MGIITKIEEYLNTDLLHVFSKYLVFDSRNLKIYRDKFGSVVIDMFFPIETYRDIDITEVEWAIVGLKQQFHDITIEFNYFIEKNQADIVDIPLYSIEIFYSEKEECFIAFAPSFEYCFAKGDSREEALQKVEKVLDDLVRHYLNEKIELPSLIEKYQDLEHDPKIK